MTELQLTDSEQREIFRNPEALMVLMTYHDIQQDQADSMGAECYGNKLRYEELKAHGKAIVEQDPAIWSNDVLRAFDVVQPSPGYQRTSGVIGTPAPNLQLALAALDQVDKALAGANFQENSTARHNLAIARSIVAAGVGGPALADQLFDLAGRIRDLPDGVMLPPSERDRDPFLNGFAQGHRAARMQAAGLVEDASRGVQASLKPWEIPGPNQPNPPLPRDLTGNNPDGDSTAGVLVSPKWCPECRSAGVVGIEQDVCPTCDGLGIVAAGVAEALPPCECDDEDAVLCSRECDRTTDPTKPPGVAPTEAPRYEQCGEAVFSPEYGVLQMSRHIGFLALADDDRMRGHRIEAVYRRVTDGVMASDGSKPE